MNTVLHSVRALRRHPASAGAVALALGIGVNTAIFSLCESLLLRKLPVRDPDGLVVLSLGERPYYSWNYDMWKQVRKEGFFGDAFSWASTRFDVPTGDWSGSLDGLLVSGEFFRVVGVPMASGRALMLDYDRLRAATMPPYLDAADRGAYVRGDITVMPASNGISAFRRAQMTPDNLLPLFSLVVRQAPGSSPRLDRELVASIRSVDPDLSVVARSLPDHIASTFARERILAALATTLGLLALALVSVGLYGLSAFIASCRDREIAVRLALGAARSRVVALVAGRVLALVARGVVLGIVAGFWCTHLLRGLIFGLPPHDWMSFGVASLVLLVISATAATIPAVRAATVDPSIALRDN